MAGCREIPLADLAATQALAGRIARLAAAGDAILLSGPLGAGKTAFARGFIHAQGGAGEVPSPTFTLVQVYELGAISVWHADLYRLESTRDMAELGLDQGFAEGVVLVEWAERFPGPWPDDRLEVHLAFAGAAGARTARLIGHGAWAGRLASLA